MPYDITPERDGTILRVRYSGQVTIKERRAAAESAIKRALPIGITRFLVDYRQASHLPGDTGSDRALAQFLAGMLKQHDGRIAWLVKYGHQLGPDVEDFAREFGVASRRFQEPGAAIDWLESSAELAQAVPVALRPALSLAMAASDSLPPIPPVQFAAITKLVEELLAEGLGDDTVLRLARRMFEVVEAGEPRPARASSGRA